ncbi:deoxyhypusine synthase [archaeon CG07_land_8_20_14_0_80_38_8]|nr:MAG: deoxyhypusine synthase [archaeon CG07_land_8_20_14_0_80_38_8]PIU88233.1 MAG: deoxyhypusine synthase [archaeon CG06_land_8_20_14_3_00_37_11]
MDEVKDFKITDNVKDLVEQLGSTGFQATNLKKASDIIKKMKKEGATIILTFTSNMASSGLRGLFAELLKRKFVDAVITGVGSIEEDLMKCSKPFILGSFRMDDKELHQKGVNRIGNILVPNDRYEALEDTLMPFFAHLLELQEERKSMLSPSEIIKELGKTITDENSILYWASRNNIPIFCPAILDGAFGLQLYYFKQEHPEIGIDVTADMKAEADLILNAEKTGGIILGGGFAKHHAIGLNIVREGFDYAVYVTTAEEYDGSLSGASASEAVSWSKIKEEANTAVVHADATIAFPLIMSAVLEE